MMSAQAEGVSEMTHSQPQRLYFQKWCFEKKNLMMRAIYWLLVSVVSLICQVLHLENRAMPSFHTLFCIFFFSSLSEVFWFNTLAQPGNHILQLHRDQVRAIKSLPCAFHLHLSTTKTKTWNLQEGLWRWWRPGYCKSNKCEEIKTSACTLTWEKKW